MAIAAVLAAVSVAQARPSTLGMTCAEVTALVAQEGGIVLSTGEFTYDRYVSGPRSCLAGDAARRSTVPTSDNGRCPLKVCRTIIRQPGGGD